MSVYKDIACVHCGLIFTDEDDIVVCPDCGAPHHRACYLELGHCALIENHAKGIDYEMPKKPEPELVEQTAGSAYAQEQYRQTAQQAQGMMYTPVGPVAADEQFDGVTAVELATFIGPNARKYISAFKVMKESHKDFSFNWSSFFFNYCFFFYRKMFKPAILLLSMMLLFSVPRLIYSSEFMKLYATTYLDIVIPYNEQLLAQLQPIVQGLNMVQLAVVMTITVFSNKMYYRHAITEIHKIRASMPADTPQDKYFETLAMRGNVNSTLGYGTVLLTVLALFGSSFLAATQLYQQFM